MEVVDGLAGAEENDDFLVLVEVEEGHEVEDFELEGDHHVGLGDGLGDDSVEVAPLVLVLFDFEADFDFVFHEFLGEVLDVTFEGG